MKICFLIVAALVSSSAVAEPAKPASAIHPAILADPPADKQHPARLEAIHIPTGGVKINGVAYVASGAGPHPTAIIFHGWPGNEKNVDLAQSVRRAGWNAITLYYRGAWGSPGNFRFAQNIEDATAALAFARDPANAARLAIDPKKIVLIGHSMGAWVANMAGAKDGATAGVVMISGGNMGVVGKLPRAQLLQIAADSSESLAGTSPEMQADELSTNSAAFDWVKNSAALQDTPVLALTSDDGLAGMTDALVSAMRKQGGTKVTAVHVATDHSWSDKRLRLQSEIINWLDGLPK